MSTIIQRRDSTAPPPLDEEYWAVLLQEGEFAKTAPSDFEASSIDGFEDSLPAASEHDISGTPHYEPQAASQADWKDIDQIMKNDEVTELAVIGYNRGGLLVAWRTLHGFVPASQLTEFPATGSESERRNAMLNLIGQQLKLRVIELNAEQNRLILSERAARVRPGERADILNRLQPGDTITGTITNLCDFGAFVDLGGLEGLIHISELSWGRVGHPMDILQPGQEVKVHVLEVERGAGRVALSLKRLHPDPWVTVNSRYAIGQTVTGIITNVVDFGAFACIETGLEGLIHVSELAEGHFLHPRNVVNEGQQVTARVISIDSQSRRLGLSLRVNI